MGLQGRFPNPLRERPREAFLWAPHCEKCSRCRRNATDSFFLLLAGPFPFSSVSAQLERLHRQAEKWLLQSVAHT